MSFLQGKSSRDVCLLKEVSEEGRQGLGVGWPRALPRLSQRLPPQRFPGTEVKPDSDESPQSRSAMTPQHLRQLEQAVSTSTTPSPGPLAAIHRGPSVLAAASPRPARAISVIAGGREVQTKMSIFIWKNGPILGVEGFLSSLSEPPPVKSLLPKDLQISGQRKVPIAAGANKKINKGHRPSLFACTQRLWGLF